MTQVTPKHDVTSRVLHFIDSMTHLVTTRSVQLSGFLSRSTCRPELNGHLRYDVGEDDCRPAAEQSFLQQQAARVTSVDQMLLRSF